MVSRVLRRVRRLASDLFDRVLELRNVRSSRPFLSVDYWIGYSDLAVFDSDSHSVVLELFQKVPEPLLFFESNQVFSYLDVLLGASQPFRLITTCNDDVSVPLQFDPPQDPVLHEKVMRLLKGPWLQAWYTKNPGLVDPKIHPLPLGPKWQWGSTEFFGENKAKSHFLFRSLCHRPDLKFFDRAHRKTGLLYFNFGDTTSFAYVQAHVGLRARLKDLLGSRFPWNPNEEFSQYLKTLSTYRFCLSPPGRGLDTHRTWEALMVGTIPIVLSGPLDDLYRSLPVLIVHDWSVLTEDYLNSAYEAMHQRTYSFESCFTPYWDSEFAKVGKPHREAALGR